MGAGSSLRKLAKDLELNPSALAEISKKYSWQERVAAFDAYIEKASQYNQLAQGENFHPKAFQKYSTSVVV